MSSNTKKQAPHFESQIPEHLLATASPTERWLMEKASIAEQKSDWQTKELLDQTETVDRIETQVKQTNGRVNKHDEDLKIIKAHVSEVGLYLKIIKNKYFLLGAGAVVLFGLPWFYSLGISAKAVVFSFFG